MHNKEHDDFSDRKFRETLNITIINNFMDLDKGPNPEFNSMLSSFFHHMQNSFKEIPHIFVSCGLANENHDTISSPSSKVKQEIEDNLSAAFTEWTMMWLLKVLKEDATCVVHKECKSLFVSLLQFIKLHKIQNFKTYILHLMVLLEDLTAFIDNLCEVGRGLFTIKNVFHTEKPLNCKDDQELKLIDIVVSFSSPEECENFQEKVTSILKEVVLGITQFLPAGADRLCKILCMQIELGDLKLKQVSLVALASLINIHGFMFSPVLVNYMFNCLQAIIIFCCDISEPKCLEELQLAVVCCLDVVVANINSPENKLMLNPLTLGKILKKMIDALSMPYFLNTCQDFQSCIVRSIISLLKHGLENEYPFPATSLKSFTQTVFKVFAGATYPQTLVPLLVYILSSEINKPFPHQMLAPELIARHQNFIPFEEMKNISTVWCQLYDYLLKILCVEKGLVKNVNMTVVHASLEILLQTHCGILNKNKAESLVLVDSARISLCESERLFPLQITDPIFCYAKYLIEVQFSSLHFDKILDIFLLLSSVKDLSPMVTKQFSIVCNIASIPWFQYLNSDKFDLWCEFIPLKLSKNCESLISSSNFVKSLKVLAFLPTNISPKWRYQVLSLSLQHVDDKIKIAAIEMLPFFVYSSVLVEDNAFSTVECLMKSDNKEVLSAVSKAFEKLFCAFGSCDLFRTRSADGALQLFPKIICLKCEKIEIKTNKMEIDCSNSDNCLKGLFLHVLQHPSELVRRDSVSNIPFYFHHNKISEDVVACVIQLLSDPDPVVRTKFSKTIQRVLQSFHTENNGEFILKIEEILIINLKSALFSSKCSGNLHFQKTVIFSIGEIGKVADNGLLLITIISLLESYMISIPSVKVVAFTKLQEIAESKNFKMQDLFKTYKDPICKFIAESLLTNSLQSVPEVLIILEEIRTIFAYSDLKTFINSNQRYILPYLISKEADHSDILLSALSAVLHTSRSDLLINNFPFIFSHFVRHCSKGELEKALTFIQKETNLDLGSLLRCNYQLIHNELLLHLSTHYEQVFSGLSILAVKSGNLKGSDAAISHTDDMANYLQPKLLGFLVFFDTQMLKSALEDKKLALESLVSIMKLMGRRAITAVRFKLMATLRIALRFRDGNFPLICCKAWDTFVHSIDITYLGPLLNQIIVALLPLLEYEPKAASKVFHFLIIENRPYLCDYFHDLYFVPDIPELQEINVVLKDYIENPSNITDFYTLLCHSLKGISHENLEVRLHALEKLKQVLQANQMAINEHLLGRENVDNLLSHLVASLIAGCRESDSRVRLSLGECLGELGAIDLGRLNIKSANSNEGLDKFYSSIDDENFAYALVQELVHSFLAADECGIQDCSACAIQEVLKFYKCSDEKGGNYLWKKFPPDIQEILVVLFHSQYKSLQRSRKKFPVPIYQSKVGSTFREWTKNWFYSLLQKVKKENPLKLFHACSIIIKYDLNCTLFLLPHLVIYALLDSSETEQDEICSEVLAVLTHSEKSGSISDLCQLSSQTIFSVLDHISKWLHHRQEQTCSDMNMNPKSYVMKLSQDKYYLAVKGCLTKIPQILLAKSSFACKAYARSLMHLEQYLKSHPDELENNTSFIQKIYTALDEPDGVAGVAAIKKEEASLMDLILENEAIGDMQGAFACYEKAIKLCPDEGNYYCGLLKCFLGMDQPTTAVSYANGILSDKPEWNEKLNQYRIEAAWKLTNWQSLESFLQGETFDSTWTVGVGSLLHLANNKDLDGFEKQVKAIRSSQMAPLSAVSMEKGSYLRGYEYLTRMHMLTDLQYSVKAIFNLNESGDSTLQTNLLFHEILPVLKRRGLLVQSSPRYQEPVHALHRVLLKIGKEKYPNMARKFDQEISNCWLKSAKLARKSGCHQRAYSCLLEAGVRKSADLFVEKTKWLWNKGEKEQAIYCLQKGISKHFPSVHLAENLKNEHQLMFAKAKLLLALYSEESSIVDSSSLIDMYKEVVILQPKWEASHFHLANYFDKMLNSTIEADSRAEIMVHVVRNFGTSLKHGCKNVYHSLPRLLDIWFDLGTLLTPDICSTSKKSPSSLKTLAESLNLINSIIVQDLYENVPLYIFLTAFPQLVSRICHSHPTISVHLQKLISKLLASYSQQSMWMMMAVSKSSYATRSRRCKDIFQEAILLNPSLGKFINDATRLADKLVELSNKNVGDCNTLSLNESFPSLLKLVDERSFSRIMLPSQTQMTVTLPNGYLCNSEHDSFPFTPVYIRGFADVVEVFPSLQKPKKLIVQGSDGKRYPIMCKPKDDLRKDCRLMEFNNLVNRYLKCDPEARRRQLYIRTYAVVPLNEECGLIEWVPNLSGFRFILSKLYKLKGMFVTGREIRAIMPTKHSTFEQKLQIFKTKFLPRFPPVFHDWFIMTFHNPTTWYLARLAYARTTAVMSMVGYIVGLGDRHGENILFDSSCGDTVHVDLNCLFNKGETMECPECVPFRLTHNMVDAMGPTGYEGAFRKACEVTMRVMRSKTDALMSVLRPFVHDPLVEWSKPKNARIQQHESGEITNRQGLTHVKDIEQRLNGIIKSKGKQRGLPLSIEGQVNHLIQEAVDIVNLSQMYIGWAAYM